MITKPLIQIKDTEVKDIFKHIYSEADGRQKELLTEAPSVKNIDDQAFKLYWTGAALRLYTKYNGTLYYLQFT